jgi:hypothetical protein
MNQNFYVVLASEPYFEGSRVVRCDCFLLDHEGNPLEPPALIQFTTATHLIHGETPSWKTGQVDPSPDESGYRKSEIRPNTTCPFCRLRCYDEAEPELMQLNVSVIES